MELELGLALPNQRSSTSMMIKGLDLNSSYNNGSMEIEKNYKGYGNCNYQINSGFADNDDEVESKDLSLLLWSGQPNEEDDGSGSEKWRNGENHEMNDDESQELVGWPPINSLRKEFLHHNHGGWMAANHRAAAVEGRVAAVRNSMYVKVKMEGVPIGRKIDLRNYNSYQALRNTLIDMFAKYTKNDRRDGDYTILYQDKEGDWMLAGDVPWESFVESVRRMEIIRNDN